MTARPGLAAALVVAGGLSVGLAAGGLARQAEPTAGAAPQAHTSLADLPGLGRVFRELVRQVPVEPGSTAAAGDRRGAGERPDRYDDAARAAALFDFEQVLAAVAGVPGAAGAAEAAAEPGVAGATREAPAVGGRSLDDYRRAIAGEAPILVPTDGRAAARDESAYRLLGLGYSTREIADMLAGRITRAVLDDAQRMLMLGAPADEVSDFLDRAYRRIADAAAAAAASPGGRLPGRRPAGRPRAVPRPTADAVVRAAARYAVSADLVRAVITCESGWDPTARSAAGAIGLMQLMPGTARELGVNPHDPAQNVEGGTRYLAGLLRAFGSIERALVAYNAGPGFAARFVRGEVALYGETREFVRRVLATLER